MTAERTPTSDPRLLEALDELRALIQRRYPEASFDVSRGVDDPDAIHLIATVDVDDLDEVVDLVIERELELQVQQRLPVHVIPVRPAGRALEELLRPARRLSLLRGGANLPPDS